MNILFLGKTYTEALSGTVECSETIFKNYDYFLFERYFRTQIIIVIQSSPYSSCPGGHLRKGTIILYKIMISGIFAITITTFATIFATIVPVLC